MCVCQCGRGRSSVERGSNAHKVPPQSSSQKQRAGTTFSRHACKFVKIETESDQGRCLDHESLLTGCELQGQTSISLRRMAKPERILLSLVASDKDVDTLDKISKRRRKNEKTVQYLTGVGCRSVLYSTPTDTRPLSTDAGNQRPSNGHARHSLSPKTGFPDERFQFGC